MGQGAGVVRRVRPRHRGGESAGGVGQERARNAEELSRLTKAQTRRNAAGSWPRDSRLCAVVGASASSIADMPSPDDRQRVAAYGVARRRDEVLLVQASSATGVPGTWWLPGGGLWFGESPRECLVREFMEETGLVARVGDVLDVVSDVAVLVREPVRLHSVRLIYEVEAEPGSERPEADGSTDAVRWVRYRDLEALPLIPWLRELAVTHLTAR